MKTFKANSYIKYFLLLVVTGLVSCSKFEQKRENGFYVSNRTNQDITFAVMLDNGTSSAVHAPANSERHFVNLYTDSYEILSCGNLRLQQPCSDEAEQNRIHVKLVDPASLPYTVCVVEQTGGYNSLYELYDSGSICREGSVQY